MQPRLRVLILVLLLFFSFTMVQAQEAGTTKQEVDKQFQYVVPGFYYVQTHPLWTLGQDLVVQLAVNDVDLSCGRLDCVALDSQVGPEWQTQTTSLIGRYVPTEDLSMANPYGIVTDITYFEDIVTDERWIRVGLDVDYIHHTGWHEWGTFAVWYRLGQQPVEQVLLLRNTSTDDQTYNVPMMHRSDRGLPAMYNVPYGEIVQGNPTDDSAGWTFRVTIDQTVTGLATESSMAVILNPINSNYAWAAHEFRNHVRIGLYFVDAIELAEDYGFYAMLTHPAGYRAPLGGKYAAFFTSQDGVALYELDSDPFWN